MEKPRIATIVDVTLRDGLQTLATTLPLATKIKLFYYLRRCGLGRIEVTSLVPPATSPQFADAEALLNHIVGSGAGPRAADLMAFTPNVKGLARLAEFRVAWASTVVATSDEFNRRNLRATTADVLARLPHFVAVAKERGLKVRLYLSTAFGCPFAGPMDPAALAKLFAEVARLGADEIALSDSTGVATPETIVATVDLAKRHFAVETLALHLHGVGTSPRACVEAAYGEGIRQFDGALAGLGGCPAAPLPAGNVATEDLMHWLKEAGPLGDAANVAAAAIFLRTALGLATEDAAVPTLVTLQVGSQAAGRYISCR